MPSDIMKVIVKTRYSDLSLEELDALRLPDSRWPYHADLDSWTMFSKSCMEDLKDLEGVLQNLVAQVSGGWTLMAWQINYLRQYWELFRGVVLFQQDMHECVFAPVFSQYFDGALWPEHFREHQQYAEAMTKILKQMNDLSVRQTAEKHRMYLMTIQECFLSLKVSMEQHLIRERTEGVMLVRKYFTQREVVHLVHQSRKQASLREVAYTVRSLPTMERKLEWYRVVQQVPAVLVWLVLWLALKKYDRETQRLLDSLKEGKDLKAGRRGCCLGMGWTSNV